MFILDLNQVMYSNMYMNLGGTEGLKQDGELRPELLRHMVLNTVRSVNVKFRGGNLMDGHQELVIACDGRDYWRRGFFPYYKAARKKGREKSDLDWEAIFTIMGTIKEELKEFFPYRTVDVAEAEADDVIAALVQHTGGTGEVVTIVSGDKDFCQLQRYDHVRQWDPVRKKDVKCPDPSDYLVEHVIRGDSGDGVPNVLSDDDTFVNSEKRQKAITAKRLAEIKANPGATPYFHRNVTLIDLSHIPARVHAAVIEDYNRQTDVAGRRKYLMNFFMERRLKNLLADLNDF